jgi:hypothetical protein
VRVLRQDEEARGGKACSLVENVVCVYTLSLHVSCHHSKNGASPGEEEFGLFSSTADPNLQKDVTAHYKNDVTART